MPSRRLQLDGLDWKFLLARSAFLLLGTLATILLTVWVPAFEELDSRWSPLLVMGITGAAEFINRWLKDNRTFYSTLLFLVAALFVAGGDAAAQSFSGSPLTPTLSPTKPVEREQQVAQLYTAKAVERGHQVAQLYTAKAVERGQEVAPLFSAKPVERGLGGVTARG